MLHLSFRLIAPFVALAALATVPVAAKDKNKTPPRPAQIDAIYACRDIADASARLACFDREVGVLATADEAKEITFTDRETAEKTRRGLFGFSFPKLGGVFGGDDDEIKNVEAVIRSVRVDRSGKYTLTMEDGAVWVQIDTTSQPRDPRPGQKVEIKTASMGSYFAKPEGGRSMRMKRDR